MKQYLNFLSNILNQNEIHDSSSRRMKLSVFGSQLKFNLRDSFPLLTTTKVNIDKIIDDLLWMLNGSSSIDELDFKKYNKLNQFKILPEDISNPTESIKNLIGKDDTFSIDRKIVLDELHLRIDSVGPTYGTIFRNAPGGDHRLIQALYGDDTKTFIMNEVASDKKESAISRFPNNQNDQINYLIQSTYYIDQIQKLIKNLKSNPYSNEHIVACWLPEFIPHHNLTPKENILCGKQALAPKNCLFQLYVQEPISLKDKYRLSLQVFQRSSNVCLNLGETIATFSLLTMMIAQCLNMEPYKFIWTGGESYIYLDQIDGVKRQLTNTVLSSPQMKLNADVKDIFKFKKEDFTLVNYKHHEEINFI